jgi:hypothetical protein
MINYDTVPNTVGTFPNVVSQNATAPGATDGTPYLKSVIDDLWGSRQALMDAAGLTPTGVTESPTASQQKEAIQKISGYPGEVIAWMGNDSDPSTLGIRLLPLNGQGILRASYPDLDAACYVGDSANPTAEAFYRADDAGGTSRNTTGIYLILPDSRSAFIRGHLTMYSGERQGEYNDWALAKHGHEVYGSPADSEWPQKTVVQSGTGVQVYAVQTTGATNLFASDDQITDVPSANIVNGDLYPMNLAALWCIRY